MSRLTPRPDGPAPDEQPEEMSQEELQRQLLEAPLRIADAVEQIAFILEKFALQERVLSPEDAQYQDG